MSEKKSRSIRPFSGISEWLIGPLRHEPLLRNASSLLVNAVGTAAFGLLYWVLAARFYSPTIVGASSAMIAGLLLVSTIAQLNLGNALTRFLAQAGSSRRRFILGTYGISALIAVLAALVVRSWVTGMAGPLSLEGRAVTIWLIAGLSVWCIFALQDHVLTGLRRATWVPIENAVFGALKIVFLIGLAASAPQLGIFASWIIPMGLMLVPINFLIFYKLLPKGPAGDISPARDDGLSRGQISGFIALDYLGSLLNMASTHFIPVLVAGLIGAKANGYFYTAWVVASTLDLAMTGVASSLTVEGAHEEKRLQHLASVLAPRLFCVWGTGLLAICVTAPLLLSIFGAEYAANSSGLLRLLAIGLLPRGLIIFWMSILRVQNRLREIVVTQGASSALILGGSLILMTDMGIVGVGIAYAAGQSAVAAFLLPRVLKFLRRIDESRFRPVRVVESEIARPLTPIPSKLTGGVSYSRCMVVVRLRGVPVGNLALDLPEHGVSADELADHIWNRMSDEIIRRVERDGPAEIKLTAQGLSGYARIGPAAPEALPFASVVIATRNRPGSLKTCLDSMRKLNYPAYEVIVVDNAPDDCESARVVHAAERDSPHLQYLLEERPGVSRARNRGLAHARGDIVAFADDDVAVDPDWLSALVRGFRAAPGVACVTGLVLPAQLDTPAQLWFEQYGGFSKGYSRKIFDMKSSGLVTPVYPYNAGGFGAGASMAFRSQVFRKIGGFDVALGPGTEAKAGEDLDAFLRIILAGHRLVYEPSSLSWHYHRRDFDQLCRNIHAYGVGLSALMTKLLLNRSTFWDVTIRIPSGTALLMSPSSPKNSAKGSEFPRVLTLLELKGIAHGPAAYLRSRRRARRNPTTQKSLEPAVAK